MKFSSITENLCLRVINREACMKVSVMAVALILSLPPLMAQDGAVRPSRSDALAAWERGDYPLAYEHYNGLLLLYSRDPLYKYYTGACLVKMERDIPRAVTLLGSAINSSVNVKRVPDDVWFYYGRALQMSGSFAEAGEAYDRFAREAGRKVAAEYDIQSYIGQCSRGQGALSTPSVSLAGAVKPVPAESVVKSKDPPSDTKPSSQEAPGRSQPPAPAGKPDPGERVIKSQPPAADVKPVVKTASGTQQVPSGSPLPSDYETLLAEAVRLQHEADSLLEYAGDSARASSLQLKADSLFMTLERSPEPPSAGSAPDEQQIPEAAHLFSDFEIRPSPAYSEKNPVPVDFTVPHGLIYTVQIAAFRNPVAPSLFKGLYPVFGGRRAGSDATYYYTGLFRRLEDAQQALPGARGAGFPDAFVIAMMDGTQVSMERARLLEREWSAKPLPVREPAITARGEPRADPADPAAPVGTLSFRAEVMRASKPVKPEVIEKLELLAGSRGLAMIKNNVGETVFLIGNFITFESADEYVSLIIRNGYSTARVAAYVGMHEIPVEAAKELLKRLQDD
jgi:hypothetical protein